MNYGYPFQDMDTSVTSFIVSKLYGSFPIYERLQTLGIRSEFVTLRNAGHEPQYEPGKYETVMNTVLSNATEFYYQSLFGFPEITGPRQIAISTAPPTYSLAPNKDVTCYWQADGGKIIPGGPANSPGSYG